jgi:coproporphyrinogen III oxidase-like Fe-S oxidoreductase
VPFCVSHCPYCDFVVLAGSAARGPANRIGAFVDALATELDLRADAADAAFGRDRPPLQSLYLGGGTPSLLPADSIDRIVEIVHRRYGLEDGAEVTLEANPGPDERGDLPRLHASGVTRLSIGAQSLDARELRALGRRHSPADVAATVDEARKAGIHSISLDLLYDVPDGSLAGWRRTLEAALTLEPDHLSLYALTRAERGAPRLPPGGVEAIDVATAAVERVMLGLRQAGGIPFAAATEPRLAAAYDWALPGGLLEACADRLVLTTRGRLLSNELFARLV